MPPGVKTALWSTKVKEEPDHRTWKNTLRNDLQAMGVTGIQDTAMLPVTAPDGDNWLPSVPRET